MVVGEKATAVAIGRRGVAFVGLGDMGLGMAANLQRAGYAVAGYDLAPCRRRMLADIGGRAGTSCADCATDAAVAFIMVMNGSQVMSAVAGKDGLLDTLRRGSVIVVSATIERDEMRAVARRAAEAGMLVVDAPVSGGLPGARDGLLSFMASGSAAALRKVKPHLGVMGKVVHVVGAEPGDGQTTKAALQALISGLFCSLAEAMALGVAAGADAESLCKVFGSSMAGSPLLQNAARMMVDGKFKGTGSRIDTIHKDVGISMKLAREAGVTLMVTAAANELINAGKSMYPGEDNWMLYKVVNKLSGKEGKR